MSGLLTQMETPQAQQRAEQAAAAEVVAVEAKAEAVELQATRRMLREQARVGRLQSVTNIFMAALLDTDFPSTQGAAPVVPPLPTAAHPSPALHLHRSSHRSLKNVVRRTAPLFA